MRRLVRLAVAAGEREILKGDPRASPDPDQARRTACALPQGYSRQAVSCLIEVQCGPSGRGKPPVEFELGCFAWAVGKHSDSQSAARTIGTKSTGGFPRPLGPPCMYVPTNVSTSPLLDGH